MADEDDEVVEEMDIILNPPISGGSSLLLLSCPDSMVPGETEEFSCKNGKVKVGHRVEFELTMPKASHGEYFDKSKSKHLAQSTDSGKRLFPEGDFNKITLASNLQNCSSTTKDTALVVTVGMVENGQIHLTPVDYTGTLGPSYAYLDGNNDASSLSSPRNNQQKQNEGESSQDEGQGNNDPQPIRARFARVESEEAKQRRMATYDYFARKQANQPWVGFSYHLPEDAVTQEHRKKFVSSSEIEEELPKNSGDILLKALLPPPDSNVSPSVSKQPEISMNMIRALPPREQIRALLKNVKVLQYQQVVPLWPRNLSPAELVQTLQEYATLVQGCWVVKSEELYPPTSSSAVSGVPAESLINGRDFVVISPDLELLSILFIFSLDLVFYSVSMANEEGYCSNYKITYR